MLAIAMDCSLRWWAWLCARDGVPMSAAWHVYLLACADGTLYTGVTTDLERRIRQHNGELTGGAKYTACRRPVTLCWSDTAATRSMAQKREAAIKSLSRSQKEALYVGH